MYDWMDVSDILKQIILTELPDEGFSDANHKWGGPLVLVHGADSRPEDHLPLVVLRRLHRSHDGCFNIIREDVWITVWYNIRLRNKR